MSTFHHQKLPDFSALLSGHTPPNESGFQSGRLQIWYNNTEQAWRDKGLHKHLKSDECFIVLKGALTVNVEGEVFRIGPREFCCFPRGVYHAVTAVETPVESFMIRAPSINDKVYLEDEH